MKIRVNQNFFNEIVLSSEKEKGKNFSDLKCSYPCGHLSKRNFVLKSEYYKVPTVEGDLAEKNKQNNQNLILSYFSDSKKDKTSFEILSTQKDLESLNTDSTIQVVEERKNKNFCSQDNFNVSFLAPPLSDNGKFRGHQNKIFKRSFSENLNTITSLIKTKNGCRFYQNKIEDDPEYANKILYQDLKPYMLTLINDQYGHFLYKEFLDVLNSENQIHFIDFISEHFEKIAYYPYGSRVIQKLTEKGDVEDEIGKKIYEMISEKIKTNIRKMCIDENANYIIQKYISTTKHPYNSFVYKEILKSFLSIATSKFGCCVIKKCIAFGTDEQKKLIITKMFENSSDMISSQYGSYVFKFLILSSDESLILKIYSILAENFFYLCKGRYSSHVIETLFEINNKILMNEMINCIMHYKSKVIDLICNEYGNQIIQKILFSNDVDKKLKFKLLNIINNSIRIINRTTFGNKLFCKIQKNFLFQ